MVGFISGRDDFWRMSKVLEVGGYFDDGEREEGGRGWGGTLSGVYS